MTIWKDEKDYSWSIWTEKHELSTHRWAFFEEHNTDSQKWNYISKVLPLEEFHEELVSFCNDDPSFPPFSANRTQIASWCSKNKLSCHYQLPLWLLEDLWNKHRIRLYFAITKWKGIQICTEAKTPLNAWEKRETNRITKRWLRIICSTLYDSYEQCNKQISLWLLNSKFACS